MSKTYTQLMKQIDSLQREAEELKRKEIEGVVERIKEAIKAYGLTAADLGLGAARSPRAAKAASKPARRGGKSRAPKYRDDAGNVWGGRGPRPAWLRAALAAGKQLGDFAVK